MKRALFIFSISSLLSLQASGTTAFESIRARNTAARQKVEASYSVVQLRKALRVVSQSLLRRDPRPEELSALSTGFAGYAQVIDGYLNSAEFSEGLLQYHRQFFEMSGTMNGINFDEPANLATYLAVNDIDFREILTATYCVNNAFTKQPCSGFKNAADTINQAAGVLTTRAFLQKWSASFNFRRVSHAFRSFSCQQYPDTRDEGMTEDEISASVKPFNSLTASPVCFSCHRTMNARAVLFYPFDVDGFYNPTPRDAVATKTDTGSRSNIADLLTPGTSPRYHGAPVSNLRDYAIRFSKTKYFRDCLARRLVNLVTGRSIYDPMPPEFQDVRDGVEFNDFKIKAIIRDVVTHPAFVLR